jgi:hypothetical protein
MWIPIKAEYNGKSSLNTNLICYDVVKETIVQHPL